MKYILVFLVVWVGYHLWRRARIADQAAQERPPQQGNTPMTMVACAHCGTHLPQTEALSDGDHFYCNAEHRARHACR